ncbi:hypothetical protein F5B21DRAFT_248402 [Xylaria acuta]|nr:hypothetical protein F5B21DRAFT_248402 [Xylaria acuta]
MGDDPGPGCLHQLHEPKDPAALVLDIVAVNGLNGNPTKTWETNGRGQPYIWIRDLLSSPGMNIRTLTYEYNSSSSESQNVFTPDGFHRAAKKLVELLLNLRHNTTERPVTFIAHDIGGLVVMKALMMAREKAELNLWSESCPKFVFFGTPQRVTDIRSWEDSLFRLVLTTATSAAPSPDLLGRVQQMSRTLLHVAEEFSCSLASHCIVNVYEEATDGPPVRQTPV